MKQQTAYKLNQLTADFYSRIGQFWNQDSTYFWGGWFTLSTLIDVPKVSPFSVLDIGCGNGRFATFCSKHIALNNPLYYQGIDYSADMLSFSPNSADTKNHQYHFTKADVVRSVTWSRGCSSTFSLVTLMGLMHHIPSFSIRKNLLIQAALCVKPGGYLCFTTWRFNKVARLQKRIVDLDGGEGRQILSDLGVDRSEFEPGDCILNWVKYDRAYRFSHHYSELELNELIAATGMQLIARYIHDGRNSDQNEYFVLQKKV